MLMVGCPVWKREWIMPRWFDHVEEACLNAAVVPHYVFVTDTFKDDTAPLLIQEAGRRGRCYDLIHHEQRDRQDRRDWSPKRFEVMVELRNLLLERVRRYEPGFFLSVDSDILLHPQALTSMLEETHRFDAIGGKCYMGGGRSLPNCGNVDVNGALKNRTDGDGACFKTSVIMALKLMQPAAYKVDYEHHHKGEDIGWSLACRAQGVTLGWDAKVCSKHVMKKEQLDKVDKRCGY